MQLGTACSPSATAWYTFSMLDIVRWTLYFGHGTVDIVLWTRAQASLACAKPSLLLANPSLLLANLSLLLARPLTFIGQTPHLHWLWPRAAIPGQAGQLDAGAEFSHHRSEGIFSLLGRLQVRPDSAMCMYRHSSLLNASCPRCAERKS